MLIGAEAGYTDHQLHSIASKVERRADQIFDFTTFSFNDLAYLTLTLPQHFDFFDLGVAINNALTFRDPGVREKPDRTSCTYDLSLLTPDQLQVVVRMLFDAGFSFDEICRIFGISSK
jgi:hypothetical protein